MIELFTIRLDRTPTCKAPFVTIGIRDGHSTIFKNFNTVVLVSKVLYYYHTKLVRCDSVYLILTLIFYDIIFGSIILAFLLLSIQFN